jgi:hypothetical protein
MKKVLMMMMKMFALCQTVMYFGPLNELTVSLETIKLFAGQNGPQKIVDSVLDSFYSFFDQELVDLIVRETNRYADVYIQSCMLKP